VEVRLVDVEHEPLNQAGVAVRIADLRDDPLRLQFVAVDDPYNGRSLAP